MNNVILIDTRKEDFFYNYIRILTPVINRMCHILSGELCYLRDQDLKVIADLMYYYSMAPYNTPLEKNKYIFSNDVSNIIMDKYNMTVYAYNNILWRLRTFGIIQGKRNSRSLHKVFYMEQPNNNYDLIIKFNINDTK